MGSRISDWNKTGWGEIPMSLGFTYSSNTLMMHLQDLVGADKMKSWYERFGFSKPTGGLFDGEEKVISLGRMNCNKNVSIRAIYNCYAGTNDSGTICLFNKGNMLKPWFVDSIKIQFQKTFYQGEKKLLANQLLLPQVKWKQN